MNDSPIQQVKDRLDIVEVIQGYIKLQKAGANFRALCPFHSEKKPSLFISPARQIWHCFGCQKGGNIFQFVMEIEGIEFGDALRILAQKAGIELKKQDPKLRTERQRLYEICELSAKFFEKQLESSKIGQTAKKYLLERGINEGSVKKWRLGYAPDIWQGLSGFLVSQGYKREEAEKAGLSIRNKEGGFYDRFRSRIIFPIFDLNSQVIGFGGRIFKSKLSNNQLQSSPKEAKAEGIVAKYVNTPATVLYDKSRVLYGLDKAKVAVRKKTFCTLVEGYIDAILSHQAGQENSVATSGTALTPYQLRILRRYSENLLTAFDMDIAGDTATKRGVDLAQMQGFNIRVIMMPGKKDPADVILEDPKKWEKIIGEAKSIVDFYFETTFSPFLAKGNALSPEDKKEISKILLPVLKKIPNKIEQSHWIQQLAKRLQVKEDDIVEELKKLPLAKVNEFPEIKEIDLNIDNKPKSRKEMLEERIAAIILKYPERINLVSQDSINCLSPGIKEIITFLKENPGYKAKKKIPKNFIDLFGYLSLKSEAEEIENEEEEIKICGQEVQCLEKKYKLNLINQEIKKAEEERDSKKIDDLIKEFNKISQKLTGN